MHLMEAVDARVSHRGQTTLPAALRHRWDLTGGGDVAIIDLGTAALIVPGGVKAAKAELRRVLISTGAYERALATLDEPDLADQ